MKIGKRMNLRVGSASIHYSEYDHAAVESRSFTILQADGRKVTWQAGTLTRPFRDLQMNSLESFNDVGADIVKVRGNKDLNPAAIERICKEKIEQLTEDLLPKIKTVTQNMQTLAETVQRGFSSVSPRNSTDIVGFLADQELRGLVRGMSNDDRRALVSSARQGGHPEIVEAILRANPLLSGLSSESANSLERAGIAASRAEDVAALRQMLAVYDDVMATTSQACAALCGLVDNSNGYKHRFEKWRQGCEGSELLREWLNKIPSRTPTEKPEPAKLKIKEEGEQSTETDGTGADAA